ncbi:MAG: efflux RND transporter periplasmic adaptor subunit [Acidobacteria bacterium]|nr:efflux RND transporter periplasmic adaptor subunit [Acidobacteriota bacterium]
MNKPLWLLLLLVGCGSEQKTSEGPPEFRVPVVVEAVAREALVDQLELIATLNAREKVIVMSEIDGMVREIGFAEGTHVTESQMLFRLDDSKIKADLVEAEANLKLAQLKYERGRKLLRDQTINQQDFDQLEAEFKASQARLDRAQEDLLDTEIKAPFAGNVGARLVSPGQFVTRGTAMTEIVDADSLLLECHVPERYLTVLQIGAPVSFHTVSFPERLFNASVTFVSPIIDPVNRTVMVKAGVANRDGALKPGMLGNVNLELARYPNALTIGEAALTFSRQGTAVMVVDEQDQVTSRSVEVGLRIRGRAQILNGLAEGDVVVVEGHQKLYPGAKITRVE